MALYDKLGRRLLEGDKAILHEPEEGALRGIIHYDEAKESWYLVTSDGARSTYNLSEYATEALEKQMYEMRSGTCQFCGKKFVARQGPKKYCNPKCRSAFERKKRPPEDKLAKSLQYFYFKHGNYISIEQARQMVAEGKHKPEPVKCLNCGKEFLPFKRGGSDYFKYCCEKCGQQYRESHKTYFKKRCRALQQKFYRFGRKITFKRAAEMIRE